MKLRNRKLKEWIFELIDSILSKFISEIDSSDYFTSSKSSWIDLLAESKSFRLILLTKAVTRSLQSLQKIICDTSVDLPKSTNDHLEKLIEMQSQLRPSFKMISNALISISECNELKRLIPDFDNLWTEETS